MSGNEPVEPAKPEGRHRRPNYLLVFLGLAALTAMEVAITYTHNIPQAPVLLTMSLAKALLVIFYFMHLRSDNRWFSLIFFVPFLLVVPLLIVLRL